MKFLSTKIANYMIRLGATFDDKELFEFGLRTILRSTMVYTLAFICSLIFDYVNIYLVFSTTFLILRQSTGGYHAKSLQACFIESLILLIGIPLLILNFAYLASSAQSALYLAIICAVLLLITCVMLNRKRASLLFFLLSICILAVFLCSYHFLILSYTLIIAVVTNLFLFLLAFIQIHD